jgi:hypothetical protein
MSETPGHRRATGAGRVPSVRPLRRAAGLLLVLALVVFGTSVAFALVPVRATAVEYVVEGRGPQVVNCGSFPFRTQWSGDAGCDRARTRRITWMMCLAMASVPFAGLGAVLMVASRDRPHG